MKIITVESWPDDSYHPPWVSSSPRWVSRTRCSSSPDTELSASFSFRTSFWIMMHRRCYPDPFPGAVYFHCTLHWKKDSADYSFWAGHFGSWSLALSSLSGCSGSRSSLCRLRCCWGSLRRISSSVECYYLLLARGRPILDSIKMTRGFNSIFHRQRNPDWG